MATPQYSSAMSRRATLIGLGAGGLGLALSTGGQAKAVQETSMADHPIVGLWQFDGGFPSNPGDPDWTFEIFHADGTFLTWGGLQVGTGLGIWRPTGERTAELLLVWRDTDPFPGGTEGPGTAAFRFDLEVDESGTTITASGGTLDARDANGVHLFPPGPFETGPSTRVTFDNNPMTGSTVTTPATPATPEDATPAP